MNNKIALLGGDLRQYTAAVMLKRGGRNVALWGIYNSNASCDGINICDSLADALSGAVAVVLPLPSSSDGVYLNCPFYPETKIKLTDILGAVEKDTVIIGGKIPLEFVSRAEERGLYVYDYFLSEEFQIHNAYITAEAALSIAMNSLDKNICDAKIAVTGYGRISKHLIRLLKSFDADITVVARKGSDLAWACACGCSVLKIGDTPELKKNIFKLSSG